MADISSRDEGDSFILADLSPIQVKIITAGVANIFNAMKGRRMESNEDYENLRSCEELNRILTKQEIK